MAAEAESALEAGDVTTARERFVYVARAHGRADRIDAALDACYQALAAVPDDVDLHLLLVDLYRHRGWDALAADKLRLLGRLAALDGDETTADRVSRASDAPGRP
jgi:hypothetical protein